MDDATDEWSLYWESGGSDHHRDILFEHYRPFAESVAHKVHKKLSSAYSADLCVQDAYMAIFNGIERYTYGHDACFETFIGQRIFGSIMDSLRRQDMLARSVRDSGMGMDSLEETGQDNLICHDNLFDEIFAEEFETDLWKRIREGLEYFEAEYLWHTVKNKSSERDMRALYNMKSHELTEWTNEIYRKVGNIFYDKEKRIC